MGCSTVLLQIGFVLGRRGLAAVGLHMCMLVLGSSKGVEKCTALSPQFNYTLCAGCLCLDQARALKVCCAHTSVYLHPVCRLRALTNPSSGPLTSYVLFPHLQASCLWCPDDVRRLCLMLQGCTSVASYLKSLLRTAQICLAGRGSVQSFVEVHTMLRTLSHPSSSLWPYISVC